MIAHFSCQTGNQELFAFYAWGKPADRLELDALEPQPGTVLRLHFAHELGADGQPHPSRIPNDGASRRLKRPSS